MDRYQIAVVAVSLFPFSGFVMVVRRGRDRRWRTWYGGRVALAIHALLYAVCAALLLAFAAATSLDQFWWLVLAGVALTDLLVGLVVRRKNRPRRFAIPS